MSIKALVDYKITNFVMQYLNIVEANGIDCNTFHKMNFHLVKKNLIVCDLLDFKSLILNHVVHICDNTRDDITEEYIWLTYDFIESEMFHKILNDFKDIQNTIDLTYMWNNAVDDSNRRKITIDDTNDIWGALKVLQKHKYCVLANTE